MRAIARRLRRLETRLVLPVDEAGMRLVELLRERERRWCIAEGREEPEEDRSDERPYDRGNLPQALVEVLQSGRGRVTANNR